MADDDKRGGRAFVVGATGAIDPAMERVMKALSPGGEVDSPVKEEYDEFRDFLGSSSTSARVLTPPILPERLDEIVVQSSAVEPCVSAMEVNVSGTGHDIVHAEIAESDLTDAQKQERDVIAGFLSEVDRGTSLTSLRRALRRDLHSTGNSYMAVERTLSGDIAFLRRLPAKSVRLVEMDEPVDVTVVSGGREFRTRRSERRFVQKVGSKFIYYKEFGASRDLNRKTGKWASTGTSLPSEDRAVEVVHSRDIENANSAYGVPRWITQLPSVLGSRSAEEQNLGYFQAGGVPPAMIFISGGMAGEDLEDAMRKFLSRGSSDKYRVGVFEVPGSGSIEGERPASIQVERFGQAASADGAFEVYMEKSEARVRRAFRLPKLFVGETDSVNFASATASIQIAEEQVFAPERLAEDDLLNATIMRGIDSEKQWLIKSRGVTAKSSDVQLRALDMLSRTPGTDLNQVIEEAARIGALNVSHGEDDDGANFVPPASGESSTAGGERVQASASARALTYRIREDAEALQADPEDADAARRILASRDAYEALPRQDRELVGASLQRTLPGLAVAPSDALRGSPEVFVDTIFEIARGVVS